MPSQTIHDFRNPPANCKPGECIGRRKEDLAIYLAALNLKFMRDAEAPVANIYKQIDDLHALIETLVQRRVDQVLTRKDAAHDDEQNVA